MYGGTWSLGWFPYLDVTACGVVYWLFIDGSPLCCLLTALGVMDTIVASNKHGNHTRLLGFAFPARYDSMIGGLVTGFLDRTGPEGGTLSGMLLYGYEGMLYDDEDIDYGDDDIARTIAVIDTNVFLGAGEEVFSTLSYCDIVIPLVVLQELEKYRTSGGGLGYAARSVIHLIEKLREDNAGVDICKESVPCGSHNTLRIEINHTDQSVLLADLRDEHNPDRVILAVTKNIMNDSRYDEPVKLITNDMPLLLLAICEGIDAEQYDESEDDDMFDGHITINLDDDDVLYDNLELGDIEDEEYDDIIKMMDYARTPYHAIVEVCQDGMVNNLLKNGSSYTDLDSEYTPDHIGPVYPKSLEQAVAMKWLLDPNIQLVSLGGVAGAGKSLLAISAGLHGVEEGEFDKVTVFRSMYAVGRQEQGFLKGDADDKMRPWAQAVWDDVRKYDMLKNHKGKSSRKSSDRIVVTNDGKTRTAIEDKYADIITVEPITYLRGRTLERQFVIIDDAQSLDRSIILDIISRLGEGSRIVFTFDMNQQDNPYLSSGTSIESLIQRLKDDKRFAHIAFRKSERSELAQLASQLLSEFKDN